MPVYNAQRQVVAVVQAIGKKFPASDAASAADNSSSSSGSDSSICAFSAADESALRALCSHISVDLENVKRADSVDTDLVETISLLKAHGKLSTLEFPPG
jgi:hypothetical protein